MYKYYNEELSLNDLKALSNCFNSDFDNDEIPDEVILKNIDDKNLDLLLIKELIKTTKYLNMKKKYLSLKLCINYYSNLDVEYLKELLLKYTENNSLSYVDIALVMNELNKKIILKNNNDVFIIKYIFYHNDDLCYSIEKLLCDIPNEIRQMELKNIIENKFTLWLLDNFKIDNFCDLEFYDTELLYLILLEDIEKFSCFCSTYLLIINEIKEFHNVVKDSIWKPNEIFILDNRYSIYGISNTLEELGDKLGLTRERVRQIIKNIVEKLKRRKEKILSIICTIYDIYKEDENYMEIDNLKNVVGEEYIKYYLAILLDKNIIEETSLFYDEDYKVIYYNNSLEDIINDKLNQMDTVIYDSDIMNYSAFEQKIILYKYKHREKANFKSGINKSLIYCNLVDDLFPCGCKIYDDSVLKLINEKHFEYYGINENIDGRVLGTYIDRQNYYMIDLGTFINRKNVPIIDEEFKSQIINYIFTFKSVYYNQIYENFKTKFNEYNIKNWYYVKGIVDGFIGKDFETKKSYVSTLNYDNTPIEEVKKFIINQEYIFTLKKIKSNFQGIKSYMIYNLIASMDNVILLSKESFVLAEKLKISDSDFNLIIENISYLFNNLKTKILSSKKLFSRMKILHSDFFERNVYIKDEYSMFSVVKVLLSEKYNFYRPFISKEKINSNSSKNVVLSYLEDVEEAKINSIMKYIQKMNIRYLTTEEIFNATGDKFVQIDKETLLNKQKFNIKKYELDAIAKFINRYIDNYKVCNISKISNFSSLPKLDYNWNKYLLLGIVRSYFKNEYSIIQKNKSNNYLNLEFEIRRN